MLLRELIFSLIFIYPLVCLAQPPGCPDPGDPSNSCASSLVDGGNANSYMDSPSAYTSMGSLPVQPQPEYFDNSQGAGGCNENAWENETGTADNECANGGTTYDADCIVFQDNNQCDQMVWTMPVTLDNPFCVNYMMQFTDATDAGQAFTMFSAEGLNGGSDEPCQLQINSCGSGQSNGAGSAIYGNLGYHPTFETAYIPGGALTVEFDNVIDGVLGSDDDFTGCSEHVSISEDGCIQEYLVGECATFNDGNCHAVEICWDPSSGTNGLLTVSIDGVIITGLDEDITNYFVPNSPPQVTGSSGYEVYFAFTAGFLNNDGSESYICDFFMEYPAPASASAPAEAGTAQSAGCSPLPVELISFEAELNKKRNITLDWSTNSEFENAYFSLERSYNGIDWEEISIIPGNGTTNETIHYSDTDRDFDRSVSATYYRLEQVDFDGSWSRSKVISVQLDDLKDELIVYPNPTKSYLNIVLDYAANKELEIYNMFGALIMSKKNFSVTELGSSHILIDTKNLNAGSYILKVGDERKMILVE